MQLKNCIFCCRRDFDGLILDETENFYLIANQNPISLGHVMVISRAHFSCFGEMPSYLYKEYTDFLKKAEQKIRKNFPEPIATEQGIHGQSINHAHTHIFPSVSESYDFSKKRFIDFIPKEIKVTKAKDLQDIKRTFQKEGQYVSIEENGQLYICHTQNYAGTFRPSRDIIAKVSGSDYLLNWKTMSQKEKEKCRGWMEETIEKWRVK